MQWLVLAPAAPAHATAGDVGFGKSTLDGASSTGPTTLQFGPDGRLYVGNDSGLIQVYTIERLGFNQYQVTATDTITSIASIRNHDDTGKAQPSVSGRLVTGLLVVGTAAHPVLYVSSSDPRAGGSNSGLGDTGLDTNSGTISRVRWDGSAWKTNTLVRGVPRSEEVHAPNGLALDAATNTLYLAVGGNTNMGAPSNTFAELPEYALSGAILSIDLDIVTADPGAYSIPTLDDPTRPNGTTPGIDLHDPFGGNDGLNQAKIVAGGPVQVYSPGYRNPYDLIWASNNKLYGTDNGSNAGAGGLPVGNGTPDCTNAISEGGITGNDSLHVIYQDEYGGHPNPTRANMENTFGGQSPVLTNDSRQCTWITPGPERESIATFPGSTDGITEYTASNFGGALQGDLLLTSFNNSLYRVQLDASGNAVTNQSTLFSNIDQRPLDVTAQGDADPFPGTIWVADHSAATIVAFEPNDYLGGGGTCTGLDDANDDDGDGFTNADEIDNGTDPCSAADVPADADNDRISNLNDPDDDNDGLPDTSDPFANDALNGIGRSLPIQISWDPGSQNPGGINDTGFRGLMTNGITDYSSLYDPAAMTVGSATGTLAVDAVPDGTAEGASNNQMYGFQRGFDASPATTGTFVVTTKIVAPFASITPVSGQSMGITIGTGGQDNYVELSTAAGDGSGAIEFRREVGGSVTNRRSAPVAMPGPDAVVLSLRVDPAKHTVLPRYSVISGGVAGPTVNLGTAITVPSSWFSSAALATGVISTSHGSGAPFTATWDYFRAKETSPPGPAPVSASTPTGVVDIGSWRAAAPTGLARQEVSFSKVSNRFYLTWGGTTQQVYNPRRDRWRWLHPLPADLDHIQSVALNGKIYSLGGLHRQPGQPKPSVGSVWIYDPATDTFSSGAAMPTGRERGAGGVAVWNGKIYYFGGLHDGVAVPWADVYDPVADTWMALDDMPRARDHFQAAIVGGTLYAIGGRQGVRAEPFGFNDAYDLTAGTWTTGLAPLPTPRGGYAVAVVKGHILVIGGEGADGTFSEVESYDPVTDTWSSLAGMPTARHGIQAVVWHGQVFVAAGGAAAGGPSPTDVTEVFTPPMF
jgi:N-acetylneuraminic acid mutarotase/glucose/arabinose dehydrogenase